MQIKTIVIFIVVTLGILLGVGGLLWQFGNTAEKPIAEIAGNKKHAQGTGPVTIVEFSDFQCPACLAVQEPFNQILTKYEGKVTFVYRYFPLTSIHKNALPAAYAAEVAGLQGKFWQMHDKLFVTQSAWENLADPKETFAIYASELGLDQAKFVGDLESQEVKDAVNVDVLAATRYGLTGTPTFFVNGIQTDFGKIDEKVSGLVN